MSSEFTLEIVARSDEDPNVRIAAIQQLNPTESEMALKIVAESDPDHRVREAAVRQLGKK